MTKWCSYCKQYLSVDNFTKNKRYSDGLQSYCRGCMKQYRKDNKERMDANRAAWFEKNADHARDKHMQNTYGITLEKYNALLLVQDNCCAICGSDSPGMRNGKELSFSVDHDHNCCPGKKSCGDCVRGLLCSKCNLALGLFGDDEQVLMTAIQYLRENN